MFVGFLSKKQYFFLLADAKANSGVKTKYCAVTTVVILTVLQ